MSDVAQQYLTRRQVAREEIETSIDLILEAQSLIAAHLLAWAAVDVLRGVAEVTGRETLHGNLEAAVRPEMLKSWRSALRDHYNFAKHADKDPHRVVEDFNPDTTHMVLLAAVTGYGTLYQQLTLPMYLFRAWVFTRSPHLLIAGAFEEIVPGAEKIFGAGAPLLAVQELYREFKRNRVLLEGLLPVERRDAVEL